MCDDDDENPFRMFERVKPFTREPIIKEAVAENPFSDLKEFLISLDPLRSQSKTGSNVESTSNSQLDSDCDENWTSMSDSDESSSDFDSEVDFLSHEICHNLIIKKKKTTQSSLKAPQKSKVEEPKNEILKKDPSKSLSFDEFQRKASYNENRAILLPLLSNLNDTLHLMIHEKRFTIPCLLELNELVKNFHTKMFINCYDEIKKLVVIPPEIIDKIEKEESSVQKRSVVKKLLKEYSKDVELHIQDLQTLILDDKLILEKGIKYSPNKADVLKNIVTVKKSTSEAIGVQKAKSEPKNEISSPKTTNPSKAVHYSPEQLQRKAAFNENRSILLPLLYKFNKNLHLMMQEKRFTIPCLLDVNKLIKSFEKKMFFKCYDEIKKLVVIPPEIIDKIKKEEPDERRRFVIEKILQEYTKDVELHIQDLRSLIIDDEHILNQNRKDSKKSADPNFFQNILPNDSAPTDKQNKLNVIQARKLMLALLGKIKKEISSWNKEKSLKAPGSLSALQHCLKQIKEIKSENNVFGDLNINIISTEQMKKISNESDENIKVADVLTIVLNYETIVDLYMEKLEGAIACDDVKTEEAQHEKTLEDNLNCGIASTSNRLHSDTKVTLKSEKTTPSISECEKNEMKERKNAPSIEENKIGKKENEVEANILEEKTVQIQPSSDKPESDNDDKKKPESENVDEVENDRENPVPQFTQFFKNVDYLFENASRSKTPFPVKTYTLLLYQSVSTFIKFLSYSKFSNNKRFADVQTSKLKDSIIQLIISLAKESQFINKGQFELDKSRESFQKIVSTFETSLKNEVLKIETDKSVMVYLQFEGSLKKFIKLLSECDGDQTIDEVFCAVALFVTTIPKIEYIIFQSLKGVDTVLLLLHEISDILETLLQLKIDSIAKEDDSNIEIQKITFKLKEKITHILELWQIRTVNKDVVPSPHIATNMVEKDEEIKKKRKRSRKKSSTLDRSIDESGCKTESLNKSRSERGKNKKGGEKNNLGEQLFKLLDVQKAIAGVEKGKYLRGFFRVNKKNVYNSYVTSELTNEDILIPGPLARNRAFDGDEVVVLITKFTDNEDGTKKKSGKVVAILQEVHTRRIVGQITKYDEIFVQTVPRDNTVPKVLLDKNTLPVEFQKENWEPDDMLYLVEILEWDFSKYALGKFIEGVGPKNSLFAESKANLLELGLHSEPVDPSLEKFLPDFPYEIPEDEIKIRNDLRNEIIFTIDPETAKDLDDALSIKKLPDGFYEVGVHIADPSFFLEEGTELDEVVLCRATSIYLVDQVIHMLPLKLCLLCSLLPGKDRLSVSVVWKMDAEGNVVETNFCRSVMRSCVQLSYAHAQAIIEDQDVELPPMQNNVAPDQVKNCVKELFSISKHIRKRRFDGGALRIDQAKMGFKLNKDYQPISKSDEVIRDSNRMIEDFMLLANESVAKFIHKHHPKIALLRRHKPPKDDHMSRISRQLKDIGINLRTVSAGDVHSSLEKYSSDGPINRIVMTSICVKLMKRAEYFCYCPADTRHYALNLEYYTHFTSPIRRYPDIMVHRLLTAILGYSEMPKWSTSYVRRVAAHSNKMKLAAKQAGDMSVDMYRVVFTRNFGPFVTQGIVTNVFNNSFDAYVQELATTVKVSTKEIDAQVEFSEHNFASYMTISWNHLPHYQFQLIQLYKVVDLKVVAHESNMALEGHLIPPKFKHRF